MIVPIRQKLMPISSYSVKSSYGPMSPQYVTIHNTANDASAASEINYMERLDTGSNVSFHYAVDDKEIVQGLPETRSAIHAGTRAGNTTSIGIEICMSKSGGPKFIQAEKNAAWLAAKILHEHGWGMDRVKKHQDWSGKYCPHRTLDMGWVRFLNMIEAELSKYQVATLKYRVGDHVVFSTYYEHAESIIGMPPAGDAKSPSVLGRNHGIITSLYPGMNNPYHIDDSFIFLNDGDIRGYYTEPVASTPAAPAPSSPTITFKVKVICNTLNVRSGPDASCKDVGDVHKGDIFTIVETRGSWGRLLSGAGWINIGPTFVSRI